MKKYKVFVEGDNLRINVDNKPQKVGFFTTRYVEAHNASLAENIALRLIREELKVVILNERSDPPTLFVEEIQEIESFGDNLVPGQGFTFYHT